MKKPLNILVMAPYLVLNNNLAHSFSLAFSHFPKIGNTVMTDKLSLIFAPTLENYKKAFSSTLLGRWFLNSLIVSVITTILTLLIDSSMAYVLARIQFSGRNILFIFILAGMMIPFEVLIIQLYLELTKMGLANTLIAVILPRLAMPIGVFILTQFFKIHSSGPRGSCIHRWSEQVDCIQDDYPATQQISIIRCCYNIVYKCLERFSVATRRNSSSEKYTITVGIANFQGTHGTEYSLIMAGAVLASIPQIIMYILSRKT